MPLIFKPKRPTVEMEFEFKSAGLTEMDGTAYYKGREYHVILGRKSTSPDDNYGGLELQQKDHDESQVEELELYGDGYTYPAIPLPPELRSLDGDVVQIGAGTALLEARMVQPWVYPDEDGTYPDNKPYSMMALGARLTVGADRHALFATLGVDSWEDVLAEQRTR